MTTSKTIKGLWYDGDGFLQEIKGNTLHVTVADGKLIDPDLRMNIKIDKQGDLRLWGDAYFSPDAGELARIGAN